LADSSTSHTLPPGTKLQSGAFSIGKALGQGGFGITYLGSDTGLKRPVALKEFFPQNCHRHGVSVQPGRLLSSEDYETACEEFLEEARRLARFQHPNICRVFHSFKENNTAYMVMEYLKGTTLQDEVNRKGPLPETEAVSIIKQVGEALEVVHQANLLHRDLKPNNLVRTEDGRVVLIDFGTAREFLSEKTQSHSLTLTPGYAPLEQYARRAKRGPFTDLYALGATLYHLLTAEEPVAATDRAAGVGLDPPRKINVKVSQKISDAVMGAMEMKVMDRPQTAQEFLNALEKGRSVPVPTPSPQPRPQSFPLPRTSEQTHINPKDGAEMVFVPAGEFTMGSDEIYNAKPMRKVTLDGYCIYRAPVTVVQYKRFCLDTQRPMPDLTSGWSWDHPIVNVSWDDAAAYAKWAGVRLPSEAEWEKTARGTDGRIYPWGNEFNTNRLWCSKRSHGDATGTAMVGSFPSGASPYGALDMAGNVWEWCADWYSEKYYKSAPNRNPTGPNSGQLRVLRGGSWSSNEPNNFRAANRFRLVPAGRNYNIGFRCAADP
jgi:formylglycine-generating enzyme required for sulfatase activity